MTWEIDESNPEKITCQLGSRQKIYIEWKQKGLSVKCYILIDGKEEIIYTNLISYNSLSV